MDEAGTDWTECSRKVASGRRVARGQDGVEVKTLVDLVLVKRNMLRFQDSRTVKVLVLCKVKLVGAIKRREVVDGNMRIRSEKIREGQSREVYSRHLE